LSLAALLLGLGPSFAPQDPSALGAGGPRDLTDAGSAFVELSTERSSYYVDEPFTLVLRFGFKREFLRTGLLQLFRQPLDVPAQLDVPWLDDLPGARLLAQAPLQLLGDEDPHPTFAVGERVTEALRAEERMREGRTFNVLEIERSYRASAPGELVLPAPILRFAFASRFEERPLEGRVPADATLAFVAGAPLALSIEPLPEEGRPPDFSGAVGRAFEVRAETAARSVAVGESFAVVLAIDGIGNVEDFPAPRLEPAGFHVYGTVDDAGPGWRRITYDLAPRAADVRAVPPLELVVFDTAPPDGGAPAYRTLRTEPLAIEVRPAPADPAEAAAASERGREAERSVEEGAGDLLPRVLVVLGLLVLGGLLWRILRRVTRSAAGGGA
jgi:hypothetical protein